MMIVIFHKNQTKRPLLNKERWTWTTAEAATVAAAAGGGAAAAAMFMYVRAFIPIFCLFRNEGKCALVCFVCSWK